MKDCSNCGHSPHLHDTNWNNKEPGLGRCERIKCECEEFK